MKFTYSWLLEHLETSTTPEEIAEKLTALGLELEEFEDLGAKFEPFIVAEILEAEKHPNADKLQVCKVNDGSQELQIVCGAANARAGIKVCLAPVGAYIPAGDFKIKKSKIRDVESNGMLCAAAELELGEDSAGIMELHESAEVGSKYADYAGLNDCLYEIAITPNRQDCLGVRGIARDLAAAGVGTLKPLEHIAGQTKIANPIKVTGAIYYIGRYFENVQNQQSPDWLQQRLKSIGLEPISALVDITNFITFDLGRPLHVYDADKLKGNISVREAKQGEKINALNGKSYELQGGEPVVADKNGVIALGGVIGNEESSVDENTKNVFLEVAYFDPDEVAKAGRLHQIDSDARYRFERGVDPDALITGCDVATYFIRDICGGEPSEIVRSGDLPEWHREIPLNIEKISELAGIEIAESEATEILQKLGFKIESGKAIPPSWRRDVEGVADLVEEILRIKGYDSVPAEVLPFATREKLPQGEALKSKAKKSLVSHGFTECVTYSFLPQANAELFGGGAAALKLISPISEDLSTMRPSILPNLVEAALRNSNRGSKNSAFFEVGPIFAEDSEQVVVTGLITGKNADKNIYGDSRDIDVFDAKQAFMSTLAALGAPAGQLRAEANENYHPGRSGGVYLGKNCLGYFGEIHPRKLKELDFDLPAVGFEIFLENIPASKAKYKQIEISDFQATTRDFAFVVSEDVTAGEITAKIAKIDPLVEKVNIFDIYEGDKMEADKKSVAFSVTLQPKNDTLKTEEIEAVSQKIIDMVKNSFNAELRG